MVKTYRPAGNSICLKSAPFDDGVFAPFKFKLYQSGTAALSAAILASIKLSNRSAQNAEIILPAYACPDLISAILYAGAKPVLVDLEQDSPCISISQINENITNNTIAVIIVNFLGISENATQIKQICNEHGISLIIDSAQWFPKTGGTEAWIGDFNIISFGRGKPISLLSGGAALTTESEDYDSLVDGRLENQGIIKRASQMFKIVAYNLAIQHYFYGIFSRLPSLKIGETAYKPLKGISAMGIFHRRLINSNIQKYQHQISYSWMIHSKLKTISNQYLHDLFPDNTTAENTALLRYPILIKDKILRNRFYHQTTELGVSILYPRPLNEISGLEDILVNQSFPNASEFSDYLVTLPTHEQVDERLIDQIIVNLKQVLNS